MDSSSEIKSTPEFQAMVGAQAREAAELSPQTKPPGTWQERALAAERVLFNLREDVMGQDRHYIDDGDDCCECGDQELDDLIQSNAIGDYNLALLEKPEPTIAELDAKPKIPDREIYVVHSRRTRKQPRLIVVARSEDAARSVGLAHEAWIDTKDDERKRRGPVDRVQAVDTSTGHAPSYAEGIGMTDLRNMLLSAALPEGEDQGVVVAVKAWKGH